MADYNYANFRLPFSGFSLPELLAVGEHVEPIEVKTVDGVVGVAASGRGFPDHDSGHACQPQGRAR